MIFTATRDALKRRFPERGNATVIVGCDIDNRQEKNTLTDAQTRPLCDITSRLRSPSCLSRPASRINYVNASARAPPRVHFDLRLPTNYLITKAFRAFDARARDPTGLKVTCYNKEN
ncbi:hypothetical protein EVAR_21119_1 [Eumeta japonica]|uniref:Uncharacterized protein n=1 Tax=Eumeta variegata TaxID=151549 RepID=A0A4C1VWB6_EUMVA|nr:hypothetical protein EVAR_21119_1 [Eumeta japonica]